MQYTYSGIDRGLLNCIHPFSDTNDELFILSNEVEKKKNKCIISKILGRKNKKYKKFQNSWDFCFFQNNYEPSLQF